MDIDISVDASVAESVARLRKIKSAEWLFELAEKAEQDLAAKAEVEASTPQSVFLPGMDELMRAMPNHIARSSLFSPIGKGHRGAPLDRKVIVSRSDAIITYSGRQLDESQADVWLQAIFEASKVPLGQPVVINRASFLRSIGRSTGKKDYLWLLRTMEDLAFGMFCIVVVKNGEKTFPAGKDPNGSTKTIHMIGDFEHDYNVGSYVLRVDSKWRLLFGNNEYALIDWEKRKQIGRGLDMAKSLQRLIATSRDKQQWYELEWLKSKMVYSSPMRKFKKSLASAMEELVRVGVLSYGCIELSTRGKEQAVLVKNSNDLKKGHRDSVPASGV